MCRKKKYCNQRTRGGIGLQKSKPYILLGCIMGKPAHRSCNWSLQFDMDPTDAMALTFDLLKVSRVDRQDPRQAKAAALETLISTAVDEALKDGMLTGDAAALKKGGVHFAPVRRWPSAGPRRGEDQERHVDAVYGPEKGICCLAVRGFSGKRWGQRRSLQRGRLSRLDTPPGPGQPNPPRRKLQVAS